MGQTLEHGIFLPDEGERNCYSGLAENWVALDTLVGAYSSHYQNTTIHVTSADKQTWNSHVADTTIHVTSADKQAWDGHVADTTIHVTSADKQTWNSHVADTTIHVTSADKQAWDGHVADSVKHVTAEDKAAWNGKADASALTAHTGDTTIHVTAADKQAWNGKQDALSQTQLDAVNSGIDSSKVQQIATNTSDISSLQSGKANDNSVVHTSGVETVGGNKTFSSDLTVANTDTTANTPNLNLRNYKADRGTTDTAVQTIIFSDKNAKALTLLESRRISNGNTSTNILCYNTDTNNNTVSGGVSIIKSQTETNFAPNANNAVTCGRLLTKWSDVQTYLVNGITPSSMSIPNFSGRVDITSYISNLTGGTNTYTPSVNGWLYVGSNNASYLALFDTGSGGSGIRFSDGVVGEKYACIPCQASRTLGIKITCTNLVLAYFVPCLGNI